jgi:integrase
VIAAAPRLRFDTVVEWWIGRFARRVASGQRRERTLELHRYHLDRHLLPTPAPAAVPRNHDRGRGGAPGSGARAGPLGEDSRRGPGDACKRNGLRRAQRLDPDNPVTGLERDERPHPPRCEQRVLGREEIARLLDACLPAYRALIATALYTGMRMSELLGLTWNDVDLAGGAVHVRAQLSRRTRELPRGESRRRRRLPCARSLSPRNSQ